jgi:hypothetical protein
MSNVAPPFRFVLDELANSGRSASPETTNPVANFSYFFASALGPVIVALPYCASSVGSILSFLGMALIVTVCSGWVSECGRGATYRESVDFFWGHKKFSLLIFDVWIVIYLLLVIAVAVSIVSSVLGSVWTAVAVFVVIGLTNDKSLPYFSGLSIFFIGVILTAALWYVFAGGNHYIPVFNPPPPPTPAQCIAILSNGFLGIFNPNVEKFHVPVNSMLFVIYGVLGSLGMVLGNIPSNILEADWSVLAIDSRVIHFVQAAIVSTYLLRIPIFFNRITKDHVVRWRRPVTVVIGFVLGFVVSIVDIGQVLSWAGIVFAIPLTVILPGTMYYRFLLMQDEEAELADRIVDYHYSVSEIRVTVGSSRLRRGMKKLFCATVVSAAIFCVGVAGVDSIVSYRPGIGRDSIQIT